MMNEHSLNLLEYDKLLEAVAGQAQSAAGSGLIRGLRPLNDLERIERRRALWRDMIALRNQPLDFPSLQVEEIGETLRQAAPQGAVVDGPQLVGVLRVLETMHAVQECVSGKEYQAFAALQHLCGELDDAPELSQRLQRSLDADGSVLDSASETLRALRRQLGLLETRIQRHLETMVKTGSDETLQERFVTVRDGRFVIPVRREARRNLPGIVHDMSNTGQTLFIEPMETHELGNELAQTRLDERAEVIRILGELSEGVRRHLMAIREGCRILAELDGAVAIARWAAFNNCEMPVFGKCLKLENARHPLLQMQFRAEGKGRRVVPLDLEVPRGIRCIAITGSNTGGKTVVLRTVGLLCAMAQSGLPVSAGPGSIFPIYDNVFADIGDEQSIQANLSTFSAHVRNISGILQECRRCRSLVLLDEIGGGTDPVEGGAIACGIIGTLAGLNAFSLITTHLALVKNYVHSRGDMLNASVRFNVKTLEPEYVLDVGRPGASHAMLIAKRLGMPREVLELSQQMLTQDQVKLEEVLSRMEQDQHRLAAHANRMAAKESELTSKRDALKAELEELRAQRRQLLMEAHRQADALVDNTRRDMENLLRGIREAAPKANGVLESERAAKEAEAARAALAEKKRRLREGMRMHGEKKVAPLKADEIRVGLRVWVEKMKSHGVIDEIFDGGGKVTVSINGLAVSMKTADLERNRDGRDVEVQEPRFRMSVPRVIGATSSEINLVGMRVDDALDSLGAFLDRSAMARMPEVRIIHGFGSGALRNAVQEFLAKNPLVADFHIGRDGKEPGGGGCTIVHFS